MSIKLDRELVLKFKLNKVCYSTISFFVVNLKEILFFHTKSLVATHVHCFGSYFAFILFYKIAIKPDLSSNILEGSATVKKKVSNLSSFFFVIILPVLEIVLHHFDVRPKSFLIINCIIGLTLLILYCSVLESSLYFEIFTTSLNMLCFILYIHIKT
jgi:hypothetical protein